MSRTLEPGISLLSAAEIRVVSSMEHPDGELMLSTRCSRAQTEAGHVAETAEGPAAVGVCCATLSACSRLQQQPFIICQQAATWCMLFHRLLWCLCLQVVVPIGPMPRDTFESYLEALNVHRHVSIVNCKRHQQDHLRGVSAAGPYADECAAGPEWLCSAAHSCTAGGKAGKIGSRCPQQDILYRSSSHASYRRSPTASLTPRLNPCSHHCYMCAGACRFP